MKNSWKWVLGIVLVLMVAVGIFGLGYIHHTQMMAPVDPQGWHGSMMNGAGPGGHGGQMMQMHSFGRGPIRGGMFFGMFVGLIPLALGLLLLYGAYRLGVRHSAPVAVPVTPAPPVAVTTSHPCPTCGNAVLDGWKHCPNCGEKQP